MKLFVVLTAACSLAPARAVFSCSQSVTDLFLGFYGTSCLRNTNPCGVYSCDRFREELTDELIYDCKYKGESVMQYLDSTEKACGPLDRKKTTEEPETDTPSPTPNVTTSTPAPLPTYSPTYSPTPTKQSGSQSGSSSATTSIAVVGTILVVVVIVIGVFLVRRKRQQDELGWPGREDDDCAFVDISQDGTADVTLTRSDAFPEGRALAAYRIQHKTVKLGKVVSQGGFGEVLRGVYNDQVVAIKRLLPSRRHDPHSIRGFVKEIQLNATLEHASLVKFIGVAWDVHVNLCMIMEFVHGGDLRQLLARFAKTNHSNGHDHDKLRIVHHVAQALTYLHSQNPPVVHRDLKSRNVLLTEQLDAKVIDFGISTERLDVTMTAGVGTSLWMAPEVMKGDRYDEKADVFSFGVILSELDTHEIPYNHARDPVSNRKMADMVLMQMVTEGKLKPRFTDAADPQIVALARDCLEVDPKKRPSAPVMVARLAAHLRNDRMQTTTGHSRTANDNNSMMFDTRPTTQYPSRPRPRVKEER